MYGDARQIYICPYFCFARAQLLILGDPLNLIPAKFSGYTVS